MADSFTEISGEVGEEAQLGIKYDSCYVIYLFVNQQTQKGLMLISHAKLKYYCIIDNSICSETNNQVSLSLSVSLVGHINNQDLLLLNGK